MLASTAWRKARDSDHVIVIYETWFDCVIERWSSTDDVIVSYEMWFGSCYIAVVVNR